MPETTLRFIGDFSSLQGILLAIVLAVVCWLLYFRESRQRSGSERFTLPTLRALAIFFVVLILAEPTLHHEQSIRQLGKLFVFVDGSQSMELTDESMSAPRKLAAMQSLGLLENNNMMQAAEAFAIQQENAAKIKASLDQVLTNDESREAAKPIVRAYSDAVVELFVRFETLIGRAMVPGTSDEQLKRNQQLRQRVKRLRERLVLPLQQFSDEFQRNRKNIAQSNDTLKRVTRTLDSLRGEADLTMERYANNSKDSSLTKALTAFDDMSRWDRCEQMLLESSHGLISRLRKVQDVELLVLRESEAIPVWWQRRGGKKTAGIQPNSLNMLPNGFHTDLGDSLKLALADNLDGVAVLLISDGVHNHSTSSPVGLARQLGQSDVPIFTIGVGSRNPARDMAILGVDYPTSIFSEDFLRGQIQISDQMPAGASYRVRVEFQDTVVWEAPLESQNVGRRTVDFRFPVKPLLELMAANSPTPNKQVRSCPLEMKVTLLPVREALLDDEAVAKNNSRLLFVQAVTQRRRILLLDGRPRWEMRYVRNLFQRQSNWETTALFDGLIDSDVEGQKSGLGNRSWRNTGEYSFPASKEALFQYDLIVMGDLPRRLLRSEELEWINDFVSLRGGGIVFLDGQRGNLAYFQGTPIQKMLPVEFTQSHQTSLGTSETRLRLTDEGNSVNALRIDGSIEANADSWAKLRSPRWTAPAKAIPGSTVLARMVNDTQLNRDAIVMRRFGAGKALYLGCDELWRWRYDVGDRFHQKFWTQVANWIGMQPFAVSGEFVNIGTDQSVYDPDSAIAFHVTLRDKAGMPVTDPETDLVALIYRDGKLVNEVPLRDDGNEVGVFRGRSGRVQSGKYSVAVKQRNPYGRSREYAARAKLIVKPAENNEATELEINEKLLREMARSSQGKYFTEQEVGRLAPMLEKMDQRKVISSETPLGHSWYWFIPIVGFLTAEWLIRKRVGYV